MFLSDITHGTTLKALQKHPEIKVEDFDTIEQLRKQIQFIQKQKYRKSHPGYFRDYMRERYRRTAREKTSATTTDASSTTMTEAPTSTSAAAATTTTS